MPKYKAIVLVLKTSNPKKIDGKTFWPTVFKAKVGIEAAGDAEAAEIGKKAAGTIGNFEAEVGG